jgi:hypothetical protein
MHSDFLLALRVTGRRASGTYRLPSPVTCSCFPLRVLAPQRFACCISKCMGLILRFGPYPTPLHVSYNGMSAFVDVDVFDRDLLLPLASMAVQSLQQRGMGAG